MSESLRALACTRRALLRGAAAAAGWLLLPRGARADAFALSEPARAALASSRLVYVSPLRRDGNESTCHGEVWFAADGGDVLVVTSSERWKARAIRAGLERARLWAGDAGVWTRSEGRFRSAPSFLARAAFESDPAARERALEALGQKYAAEWGQWGPRFRDGLADGTRVLIRYAPMAS